MVSLHFHILLIYRIIILQKDHSKDLSMFKRIKLIKFATHCSLSFNLWLRNMFLLLICDLHLDFLRELLHKLSPSVFCCNGHRIIEMNNNSPPLTFKRFQTIVSRLELPRRPLPPITQQQMDKCRTKIADNHDQLYSIPTLEELGIYEYFLNWLTVVEHLLVMHLKFSWGLNLRYKS